MKIIDMAAKQDSVRHGERQKEILLGLMVFLASFIVYANSLSNGFVWDDTNVIVNNPSLKGSPLSLFMSIDATHDYELLPYYRPLTALAFLLEERIHGLLPLPMHLVNVFLHALNALLVFRLARSFSMTLGAAFFAGILFAIHPINTEAVNFLSARNTILSTFFILCACLLYRRSIEGRESAFAFAGAVFFLAGLFSKETAIMFLPFVVLQEFFYVRGDTLNHRSSSLLRISPFVAALVVYLAMRWMTLSSMGIQSGIVPGIVSQKLTGMYKIPALWSRLADNFYIIPKYLMTIIMPAALSPRYIVPDSLKPLLLPLCASWIFIFGSLCFIILRRRSKATLTGLLWMVLFWLPVSGIVWFPSAPIADRYMYLPAVGLWLVIADQTGKFFVLKDSVHRVAIIMSVIILMILAGLTVRRNMDWKSDIALFSRLVQQYPDNAYGYAALGEAYFFSAKTDNGDMSFAEEKFEEALALNPHLPGVHTKLGYIRLSRGDNEGALRYYTLALGIYPLDKEALLNRGITLENLNRQKEAVEDFRRFLSIPGHEFADARPYAEGRIRELLR